MACHLHNCKDHHPRFHSSPGNFSFFHTFQLLLWRGVQAYLLCIHYFIPVGLARMERDMGTLYISILYLVYRVLRYLVQYACPIILPLLVAFKPFEFYLLALILAKRFSELHGLKYQVKHPESGGREPLTLCQIL